MQVPGKKIAMAAQLNDLAHRCLVQLQITWFICACSKSVLTSNHCISNLFAPCTLWPLCVWLYFPLLPGRCMLVVTLSVLSLTVDLVSKERKQPIMHLPSWKLFLAANLIICTCTKIVVSRVNWIYHLFESMVWKM